MKDGVVVDIVGAVLPQPTGPEYHFGPQQVGAHCLDAIQCRRLATYGH